MLKKRKAKKVKKIIRYLKLLFIPVSVLFLATVYTGAYFSSSISSSGNGFSAGMWSPGKATITEVFYDAVGTDTGLEWIEIENTGGYALDMTGYVLHFDGTGTHDFIFPTFSLVSGAKVLVHVRAIGTNTPAELFWSDTNGKNMGDSYGSVVLFNALPKDETTIVDFVQYGAIDQDGEPKAVTAGIWTDNTFVPLVSAPGISMELISSDNNLVADWQEQIIPNPGS